MSLYAYNASTRKAEVAIRESGIRLVSQTFTWQAGNLLVASDNFAGAGGPLLSSPGRNWTYNGNLASGIMLSQEDSNYGTNTFPVLYQGTTPDFITAFSVVLLRATNYVPNQGGFAAWQIHSPVAALFDDEGQISARMTIPNDVTNGVQFAVGLVTLGYSV